MKNRTKVAVFIAILAFSFQYIGCGGAEITSAKQYRTLHNYNKANDMLLQALKSDPHSDEGWALYVQNLYDLNQYEKIADVIDTAKLYAIKNRQTVEDIRHNTWVQLYNSGIKSYQQNPDSKEQQQFAIGYLESAKKIAPEQPETYEALGDVYNAKGDTAKAMQTYEDALAQVRTQHDQGTSLGLTLGMSPETVIKTIGGEPSKKFTEPISETDSALIYKYTSNEGYFYFFKAEKPPHNWNLLGWRFTPYDAVGSQPMKISVNTYLNLASFYYANGNKLYAADKKPEAEDMYNKVIPLLISVQRLDPADENASTIIPDIYSKLDQPEKAKSMYKRMLAEHPSKQLYAAYGAVLLKANDFQGGIDSYEKALSIDPGFENALYNLGVAYQNWAADKQKHDKKADVKPDLEKSVSYYERVRSVDPKEFNSLANLYQLYDILGNKDQQAKVLTQLEGLKNTDAAKDKWYWNSMMKIYANAKRAKDADEAMKMMDSLK
ncbi:MAG TPA: tetratricopeptide repeat protein [Candidatus Kapabacteria bacterium]|nr:tetratricopeptide repeat protein [Candidatus Kapabacteria bacterium]